MVWAVRANFNVQIRRRTTLSQADQLADSTVAKQGNLSSKTGSKLPEMERSEEQTDEN